MKKLFCLFVFAFCCTFAQAARLDYDNFSKFVDKENLKYFAEDMGGLLGSGTYTTGRILGWGGFQLSGRVAYMPKQSEKNTALGPEEGHQLFPWIQGEIGLPFRLDGFIRASSFGGLTIAGGGLKWGIVRPTEILYTFQPMIVVMAQSGVHKDFSLTQYNAEFVLSFKLPYVVPYIGGGVDSTKVTVESSDNHPDLVGYYETVITPRATFGLNFKLPLYMDLSVAGNYTSYGVGGEASFGVRF